MNVVRPDFVSQICHPAGFEVNWRLPFKYSSTVLKSCSPSANINEPILGIRQYEKVGRLLMTSGPRSLILSSFLEDRKVGTQYLTTR
jgi:hypothetical protein